MLLKDGLVTMNLRLGLVLWLREWLRKVRLRTNSRCSFRIFVVAREVLRNKY